MKCNWGGDVQQATKDPPVFRMKENRRGHVNFALFNSRSPTDPKMGQLA